MAKRDFIETPVDGAYPPPASSKGGFWPASNGDSDYEGEDLLGGDGEIHGNKLVLGGPNVGNAPEDLFSYIAELNGKD